MTKRFWACVVACAALLTAESLQAHHSLAGVYDLRKVERATGIVQKFAFTNPHGALHIAIKDSKGEAKVWQLTTGSANVLTNAGVSATGGVAGAVATGAAGAGVCAAGADAAGADAAGAGVDAGAVEAGGVGADVDDGAVAGAGVAGAAVLAPPDASPPVANQFEATIVWMHEQPMLQARAYLMKLGTSSAMGNFFRSPSITALEMNLLSFSSPSMG